MESQTAGKWRDWISFAGGLILGVVLLVAGYAKLLEPGAFAGQVRLEGLDFLFTASVVAIIAIGLEMGLGLALALGIRSLWVMIPATGLVVFFVFLTGRNYWLVSQGLRSPDAACGCFGSLLERTPAEAFWQDLFLLVPALLLALFWGRARWFDLPRRRFVASVLAGLAVMLWTWTSEDLRFAEEAARIAASVEHSGFSLSRQYELRIDGNLSETSRIYESEANPSILILGTEFGGGVLVDPRNQKVRKLQSLESTQAGFGIEEVDKYPELGDFRITAEGIAFELGERQFLLGFRSQEVSDSDGLLGSTLRQFPDDSELFWSHRLHG